MFRDEFHIRGLKTLLFACGSKPLGLWEVHCNGGYVVRVLDPDIKSSVIEIRGNNVSTTYITCPKNKKQVLGITLPFLVMIVKNLKKYFSFEVTIFDDTGFRRRFRVSNFQSSTQIRPLCTAMPIGLSDGWNQIQFNLAEFTRRAYNTKYLETQALKINCNIRLRRVYFAERLLNDEQLPAEYKIFFPLMSNIGKKKAVNGKDMQQISSPPMGSKVGLFQSATVPSHKISQDKMEGILQEALAQGPVEEVTEMRHEDANEALTGVIELSDEPQQDEELQQGENLPEDKENTESGEKTNIELTEEEIPANTENQAAMEAVGSNTATVAATEGVTAVESKATEPIEEETLLITENEQNATEDMAGPDPNSLEQTALEPEITPSNTEALVNTPNTE